MRKLRRMGRQPEEPEDSEGRQETPEPEETSAESALELPTQEESSGSADLRNGASPDLVQDERDTLDVELDSTSEPSEVEVYEPVAQANGSETLEADGA